MIELRVNLSAGHHGFFCLIKFGQKRRISSKKNGKLFQLSNTKNEKKNDYWIRKKNVSDKKLIIFLFECRPFIHFFLLVNIIQCIYKCMWHVFQIFFLLLLLLLLLLLTTTNVNERKIPGNNLSIKSIWSLRFFFLFTIHHVSFRLLLLLF